MSAAEQMALDERLARDAAPCARLFLWHPPALSWGLKQPMPEWIARLQDAGAGVELVERPTGGGVAFHGSDVSCSLVVPRSFTAPIDRIMRDVCRSAVEVCRTFGADARCPDAAPGSAAGQRITYCLTQTAPYAIFLKEKKLAGFAIRRYPDSWLIQGSLLVAPLPEALRREVPENVQRELAARAIPLAESVGRSLDPTEVARRWADCLRHSERGAHHAV